MKKYRALIFGAVFDFIMIAVHAYLQNVYFEILWATILVCQVIGLATVFIYNTIQENQ